jgi:hypothetical protein
LRAGPHANLIAFEGQVVKVAGPLYAGTPPLLVVQTITRLFDVTISAETCEGASVIERYLRVSIGVGAMAEDSLVRSISAGSKAAPASTLVSAVELDKSTILSLPRGKTSFRYLDCLGSRFDRARFDHSYFPDGVCGEPGIFDVSCFAQVPPDAVEAVFAAKDRTADPPVKITVQWVTYDAGAFVVNLPADLPPRFGGRFNEARFGQTKGAPELYSNAVAEPQSDDRFLVKLINDKFIGTLRNVPSNLVTAEVTARVDLGWVPVKMPFRKPQFLTLGRPGRPARLYLAEEGLSGFIKLEARADGATGNEIAVSARQVGPAIYDVAVIFGGSSFENACAAALGQPLGNSAAALLKPGPIGLLQARAAGVRVEVTRDRAFFQALSITH